MNGDMYTVQRKMIRDEIGQGEDLQEVCFFIIIIIMQGKPSWGQKPS